MGKKKNKKRNPAPSQPLVRLSQCMIVKNEEKNIERALSWAKDVVFEQIVVDTGSIDRTVEIAERMGAKVLHFEWIDDFSAAKNFAMNQAKGNWIAILDADEYMPPEDVKELMPILKKIQSSKELLGEYDSINTSWVQLNDEGRAYAVLTVQRIFRNRPDLRYEGRIHEAVRLRNRAAGAENLRIMHTGYAQSVYNEANKMQRNIELLRTEYERDPDNPHTMLYLADSIKAAGTEETRMEAEGLFLKALASNEPAEPAIRRLAYDFLIPRFSKSADKKETALRLCFDAIAELPNHIDYYYYRAVLLNQKGDFKEAQNDLAKCEAAFASGADVPETRVLMPSPILLYHQLTISAQGSGDEQGILSNEAIIQTLLKEGKFGSAVAGTYMAALFGEGKTGVEVFGKLAQVYNLHSRQDLMLIANAAKDYGIMLFAQKVIEMAEKL